MTEIATISSDDLYFLRFKREKKDKNKIQQKASKTSSYSPIYLIEGAAKTTIKSEHKTLQWITQQREMRAGLAGMACVLPGWICCCSAALTGKQT